MPPDCCCSALSPIIPSSPPSELSCAPCSLPCCPPPPPLCPALLVDCRPLCSCFSLTSIEVVLQACINKITELLKTAEHILAGCREIQTELYRHEAQQSLTITELKKTQAELEETGRFFIAILSRLDGVKLQHALEAQLKEMEAKQKRRAA